MQTTQKLNVITKFKEKWSEMNKADNAISIQTTQLSPKADNAL